MPILNEWLTRAAVPAAVMAVALGLAPAARAGLGEAADSVERDRVAMQGGEDVVTLLPSYDVHESVTADGTRVRQFVARSGTVFGVAWSGRTKPDLQRLLASHHAAYLQATAAGHFNHKVLTINTEGLALTIQKLPRALVGAAYVPALLPAGVSAAEVR